MTRELGLSDAQRQKVEDIHERTARKAIQARADLGIAALEMRKLMRSEKPDLRAVEAQIDRIAAMRAGIAKARAAAHLEMRSVLTPEQQKKLRTLHEQGPPPGRRGPGGPMGWDDGEEGDGDI
jgi:Spy/CpxP family protein refolding chaperone